MPEAPQMPPMTYSVHENADRDRAIIDFRFGDFITVFHAVWPWQTVYELGAFFVDCALAHGAKAELRGGKRFGRLVVLDGGRGEVAK